MLENEPMVNMAFPWGCTYITKSFSVVTSGVLEGGVTECYTGILEMYTSPLDSHSCISFFLKVEDETNDEDNNESVKAGPRAELTQFVKRKKPPVHLDRIVDCLHYKVLSVVYCISLEAPCV